MCYVFLIWAGLFVLFVSITKKSSIFGKCKYGRPFPPLNKKNKNSNCDFFYLTILTFFSQF